MSEKTIAPNSNFRQEQKLAPVLDNLEKYFRKYLRVGEDEFAVLPVWVLHTWIFAALSTTPYLHITSPIEGCGKTLLAELIERVVPLAALVSSYSASGLANLIDSRRPPVLLIDEFDQLMKGDREKFSAIIALANSGYRRSGSRLISQRSKSKDDWKHRQSSTFCPKVICGISSLPATTQSRCIPIMMEPLKPGEIVEDVDEYVIQPEAEKLKKACRKWAATHVKNLSLRETQCQQNCTTGNGKWQGR